MGVNRPWKSRFRWKYAHIKAGVPHDFVFDDEEILCVRSRPEVVRNETNQVTQVLVRSESEAKDQMKALQRKHPKMEFDFTMTKSSVLLEDVQIRMKAGIDLGLLALKMSVAHATLLDDFNLDQVKTAVHYLNFRRW
jgi:molybdopterin-biosynthesis enzyme MoeA-like protein